MEPGVFRPRDVPGSEDPGLQPEGLLHSPILVRISFPPILESLVLPEVLGGGEADEILDDAVDQGGFRQRILGQIGQGRTDDDPIVPPAVAPFANRANCRCDRTRNGSPRRSRAEN